MNFWRYEEARHILHTLRKQCQDKTTLQSNNDNTASITSASYGASYGNNGGINVSGSNVTSSSSGVNYGFNGGGGQDRSCPVAALKAAQLGGFKPFYSTLP